MTDYRSEAEKFVTDFIDYVNQHNILDQFNKRTQKMERSPGVDALVKQAMSIFPDRQKGPTKLSNPELDEAIKAAPNVVDTRSMFARRTQENGGVRAMLRAIVEGSPDADEAVERAKEFFAAEDGTKKFDV